jgi:hypothetical protein
MPPIARAAFRVSGGFDLGEARRTPCHPPRAQIEALITAYSEVRVQPFLGRGLSILSWATI